MAVNYAFMRTEKLYSKGDIVLALQHNDRSRVPQNANPDMPKNERIKVFCEGNLDNYSQAFKNARKKAVFGVEWLFTASDMTNIDLDEWGRQNLAWVEKEIGKENILHAVIHLDEKTPHMHIITIPTETTWNKDHSDTIQKLNCKKYLGGSKWRMKELQDNYYERVASNFGLVRGKDKRETGAYHKHHSLNEVVKQLEKQQQEIKTFIDKMDRKIFIDKTKDIVLPEFNKGRERTFHPDELIVNKKEIVAFVDDIKNRLQEYQTFLNQKWQDFELEKERMKEREYEIEKLENGDYSKLENEIDNLKFENSNLKTYKEHSENILNEKLNEIENITKEKNKIEKNLKNFTNKAKQLQLQNGKTLFDIISSELAKDLTKGR